MRKIQDISLSITISFKKFQFKAYKFNDDDSQLDFIKHRFYGLDIGFIGLIFCICRGPQNA